MYNDRGYNIPIYKSQTSISTKKTAITLDSRGEPVRVRLEMRTDTSIHPKLRDFQIQKGILKLARMNQIRSPREGFLDEVNVPGVLTRAHCPPHIITQRPTTAN